MEKYWELEPNKVQVEIKDQSHLDELLKMCEFFGLETLSDEYNIIYPFFSKGVENLLFSDYEFQGGFTVVTTEQFYEILCHNYGYQEELKGFDKDVVLKMLEYQEDQYDNRDIREFENYPEAAFVWDKTIEGHEFWKKTIKYNKGKFPDQKPILAKDEDYKKLYHDLLEKFNQLKKIIN